MKPLTIEQLKSLKVGDWVWIVDDIINGGNGCGRYIPIKSKGSSPHPFYNDSFEGYGHTWLAYKNKEQAETKGDIIELPCKVGDTMYGISAPLHIEKAKLSEVCYEVVTKDGHHLIGHFGISLFTDKSQAEARLKELQGE